MLLSSNNNLLFSCFEALIMADMTSCGNALYKIISASYPDASLSMKMCAQRKAGRRQRASPAVCTLPMVTCSSSPVTRVSREPLPCEKRRAWGGIWNYNVLKHLAYSFAVLTSYIYRDMKNAGISKSAQEKTQFRRSPIFWKSAQIWMASAARDFDVESGAVCVKK